MRARRPFYVGVGAKDIPEARNSSQQAGWRLGISCSCASGFISQSGFKQFITCLYYCLLWTCNIGNIGISTRSSLYQELKSHSIVFFSNSTFTMASSILPSFLGALQASLAVLLTISYGFIASRFNLLKESSARDISKLCVRLFLPALLITNVGSELHADTVHRYVPILSQSLYTGILLHFSLHSV